MSPKFTDFSGFNIGCYSNENNERAPVHAWRGSDHSRSAKFWLDATGVELEKDEIDLKANEERKLKEFITANRETLVATGTTSSTDRPSKDRVSHIRIKSRRAGSVPALFLCRVAGFPCRVPEVHDKTSMTENPCATGCRTRMTWENSPKTSEVCKSGPFFGRFDCDGTQDRERW